jgi:hypothetical protein
MERRPAKIFMEGNLTFMEGFSGGSIARVLTSRFPTLCHIVKYNEKSAD